VSSVRGEIDHAGENARPFALLSVALARTRAVCAARIRVKRDEEIHLDDASSVIRATARERTAD
jgi:hypothetical protein